MLTGLHLLMRTDSCWLRLIGLRSLKQIGWSLLKPIDSNLLKLTDSCWLRLIDSNLPMLTLLRLLKQIDSSLLMLTHWHSMMQTG